MDIDKDMQANDGVVIRIEGISKHYQMGETIVRALDGVDLSVKTGEMLSRPASNASPPRSPAKTPPIAEAKNQRPNI